MEIISCKRCGRTISASDVNLESSIAKCRECDAVFDFRYQLSGEVAYKREEISAPKGMEMRTTLDGIEIVRRWYSSKVWGLFFFCVVWDGFLVFWFGTAFSSGQLSMAAFGILHALLGLGLTYFLIAGFINRTHVRISFNDIGVTHRPLPWFGNKQVSVASIGQVFTKRKRHRNKNQTSYSYEVRFLDRSGERHTLVPGLETPDQALYMEQEIEKTLGITDSSVEGEWGGHRL